MFSITLEHKSSCDIFFLIPGVEVMLGHRTWPNVFTTWSVMHFPKFKLCPVILRTKNRTFSGSYLCFKIIDHRSRNNEPKRCLFLTHNIIIVCSVLGRLLFFLFLVIPGNHNMFDFSHNFYSYHRLLQLLYPD